MRSKEAQNPQPERRAIKLGSALEDTEKLIEILAERNAEWTVHWETDSYLLDPDTANAVRESIQIDDVTETYQQLSSRTSGYQVLRIGREMEISPGMKIRTAERIIRDYVNGEYIVVDSSGYQQSFAVHHQPGRLVSGGLVGAPSLGKDPIVFDTLEEAKKAFLDQE